MEDFKLFFIMYIPIFILIKYTETTLNVAMTHCEHKQISASYSLVK